MGQMGPVLRQNTTRSAASYCNMWAKIWTAATPSCLRSGIPSTSLAIHSVVCSRSFESAASAGSRYKNAPHDTARSQVPVTGSLSSSRACSTSAEVREIAISGMGDLREINHARRRAQQGRCDNVYSEALPRLARSRRGHLHFYSHSLLLLLLILMPILILVLILMPILILAHGAFSLA